MERSPLARRIFQTFGSPAIGYQEIWAYKPHKGRQVAAPVRRHRWSDSGGVLCAVPAANRAEHAAVRCHLSRSPFRPDRYACSGRIREGLGRTMAHGHGAMGRWGSDVTDKGARFAVIRSEGVKRSILDNNRLKNVAIYC